LSPDGFDIERDKTYDTKEEAFEAMENFIQRFQRQGYYSLSNRTRLPLTEIRERCRIVPFEEQEDDTN
jgi:hypothetical protein